MIINKELFKYIVKNTLTEPRIICEYLGEEGIIYSIEGQLIKPTKQNEWVTLGKHQAVLHGYGDKGRVTILDCPLLPKNHTVYRKHILEMSALEFRDTTQYDLYANHYGEIEEYFNKKFESWIKEV
jgi:hypothetical protein